MLGFCGAVDFETNGVNFSALKKMCGLHGSGCAFINREFGVLCETDVGFGDSSLQPVTVKYNGALYTAAVALPLAMKNETGNIAQGILEGYFELGDEFISRLNFPYALVLYDGRCGELLLAKGREGNRPLFYTVKDGTVYFASSLRPLIRLYGGCVRISKRVLKEYITGDYSALPDGLFCDIASIRQGQSLLCSRLSKNIAPTPSAVYPFESSPKKEGCLPDYPKKMNLRRILTDALFAFDYPQFDCLMPPLLIYARHARENGNSEICVADPLKNTYEEYSAERADRLGALCGTDIGTVFGENGMPSTRELKRTDKALDVMLNECYADTDSFLMRTFGDGMLSAVNGCRSLPMRIRRKGMLIQCSMWFEAFNLIMTE